MSKEVYNSSPKFSIIINNYNYEEYIGEAIISVLNQTFTDFELIIVDDGSTDNSRVIINSFKDKRIKVVFKSNGGQASALNAGFIEAKGSYVAFLDSDDLFSVDKLELTLNAFKDKDYAVVQHQMQVIDKFGRATGDLFPRLEHGELDVLPLYSKQKRTNYFSATSGLTIPHHILREIFPLPEAEWKICADAPLTRPLPIFGTVYTMTKPVGYYRIHGSNNWQGKVQRTQSLIVNNKINQYLNLFLQRYGILDRINSGY